jgi:hypothetical protein
MAQETQERSVPTTYSTHHQDDPNRVPRPDLLSSVIAAHGGLARWDAIRSIDVTFNFSGGLLSAEGYPSHYQPTVTVDTHKPHTVLQRLGTSHLDDRWIYTPARDP